MDKSNQCYECSKPIKGSKIFECNDCSDIFCKTHIKINDSDHSQLCFPCFRKKIHLEVTLSMESETLSSKTELETLKSKLKTCKKDLESKKSTIERCQNQIKINEKTFLRKFESLEKQIEEEAQRSQNLETACESLKANLEDIRRNEETSKEKLEETRTEHKSVHSNLEKSKQETNKAKIELSEANEKSKEIISYNALRNLLCNTCKNKVKLAFRQDIIDGNKDRTSLVQSVLAIKERMSLRQSQMAEGKKDEKACCLLS